MIEIAIPKDIRKYEAKVVAFFTLRGLICAAIMGVCALIAWFFAKYALGIKSVTDAFPIMLIFMTPGALFGWVKPLGLPFEMFLYYILYTAWLTPKHRVHKIDNTYVKLLKELDKEEADLLEKKRILLKEKPKKKKKQKNISTLQKPKLKPNKNPDYYGFI